MYKYFDETNFGNRVGDLMWRGFSISWDHCKPAPCELGYVIEIAERIAVSKPCFEELVETSDSYDTEIVFLEDVVFTDSYPLVELPVQFKLIKFIYSDVGAAVKMELRVSNSARDKRKDRARQLRLVESGGFHNREVIEDLFRIQQGRCYYSGAKLEKKPKNYAVDHLEPVYSGGSDWPENLALVLSEVNLKKGAFKTDDEILDWLEESRGAKWRQDQSEFMDLVDEKRKKLDMQFKRTAK